MLLESRIECWSERGAQPRDGSMQMRFHGSGCDAERLCDIVFAHVDEIAKNDCIALASRQGTQRLCERYSQDCDVVRSDHDGVSGGRGASRTP